MVVHAVVWDGARVIAEEHRRKDTGGDIAMHQVGFSSRVVTLAGRCGHDTSEPTLNNSGPKGHD